MTPRWWTHRRWKIAGALAVTETVSYGILYYAFSVFLVPMQQEFGWSILILTGALSCALLVSGLLAPLVGRWLDNYGPRGLMTIGSVLGTACVIAWSRTDSIWAYYAIWCGIGVAMATTLYEPAFTTLIQWFDRDRDRSRAFLLVTVVAGFASTIFLPLSGLLLDAFNWREVLLMLAVVLGVLSIPLHALVLRPRPPEAERRLPQTSENRPSSLFTMRRLLRQPTFLWLSISFVLQSFSTVAVGVALIPYLIERGDDPAFAALVAGFIGAAQVLARVVATAIGSRVSTVYFTACVFALQAVALGVLLAWQSDFGILVAVLLLGMGRGVVTLMRPLLVADFYGRLNFGEVNGVLALCLTFASASAPIGLGLGYAVVGSYGPIIVGMAVLSILAAISILHLARIRRIAVETAM